MKPIFHLLVFMTLLASCSPRPSGPMEERDGLTDLTGYDSLLAVELGADDRGMSRYVMAFLKKGPNRPADSAAAANLQKAHMENIGRLAREGKLILAGPFLDNGDIRGIYLFDVQSIEEAQALTQTDPAIQAGSLVMELHPWYGSAALKKVNGIHDRITRK